MGNEAIAWGAFQAGVRVVCGYPGTPSTEVLETCAKLNDGTMYVEWSVNEKAAMETAAGASYTGARTMVTMKQVGLNVASDPLMSFVYIGCRGGTVILCADDPGPISSQTEQDTRRFAGFSKLPVLDPSTPEEAYRMTKYAFELSEKLSLPVILRPTTRVCHGCASIKLDGSRNVRDQKLFEKNSEFVIFPALSYRKHFEIEEKLKTCSEIYSDIPFNEVYGDAGCETAAVASGVSFSYTLEALNSLSIGKRIKLIKLCAEVPFPLRFISEALKGVKKVIVFEELDYVIEDELLKMRTNLPQKIEIFGKHSKDVPYAGELSCASVKNILSKLLNPEPVKTEKFPEAPFIPKRPPVLCAGCPHRASFYAVKRAMKGKNAVFCGDIGCYTLGNAMPLDMVDTCLCMGASVTVAQGLFHAESFFGDTAENSSEKLKNSSRKYFSFIGDSTFFASGITGLVNAAFNGADITVIVLDNSTTAMTGHQVHPGIGRTVMNAPAPKLSIEDISRACGAGFVEVCDPFDYDAASDAVKRAADYIGLSVLIFRSPCIALEKQKKKYTVDSDKCIGCGRCVKELGCPAIFIADKKAKIDAITCTGCALCSNVCPVNAITIANANEVKANG